MPRGRVTVTSPVALLAAAALVWPLINVPAAAQRETRQPSFAAATTAVIVDVVVRDRDHRPVLDLTAADFEVLEDGVRQIISSFSAPEGARAEAPTAGARPSSDSRGPPTIPILEERPPAVIAFAFEQLSPVGRRLAERAASALVSDRLGRAAFAGVFAIDRALHVLVPYTNDTSAVLDGIRQAALRPGYPRERAGYVPGAEYGASDPGQPSSATRHDEPFARGHATLEALGRLVGSLRALPGRKAVILFSEGLALDAPEDLSAMGASRDRSGHFSDHWLFDSRRDHFLRLLALANESQVAFYTFDAAGLRVESPFASTVFGRAPYVGLQFLAEETGGVFVENTNDLEDGVRSAVEDLGNYYLLGYTSTKRTLDEKYRRIEVRVRRRGLNVLARKGYRASVRPAAPPVHADEVAPLLILDQPTVPNAFPLRVGAFGVPTPVSPGRTLLVARVPGSALHFKDPNAGAAAARLTLLARLKDDAGQVRAHESIRYEIGHARGVQAPSEPADLVFAKAIDLAPGVYTLEVVGYDSHAGQASMRVSTVDVRAGRTDSLTASSLLLMNHSPAGSPAPTVAGDAGALQFGPWRAVPNLGEPFAPDAEVAFAFAAYPDRHGDTSLEGSVAILHNGNVVAAAPMQLASPDDEGRIAQVGRIPLPNLEEGTYQLAVTLRQGDLSETRSALFTVRR